MGARAPRSAYWWMCAVAPAGDGCAVRGGRTGRRSGPAPDRPAGRDVACGARSTSRPVSAAVGARHAEPAPDTQPSTAPHAVRDTGTGCAESGSETDGDAAEKADVAGSRRALAKPSRAARQAGACSPRQTIRAAPPAAGSADTRTTCGEPPAAAGGTLGCAGGQRRDGAAVDHYCRDARRNTGVVRPPHPHAAGPRRDVLAEAFAPSRQGTGSQNSRGAYTCLAPARGNRGALHYATPGRRRTAA
jgi:hypothetical protein